MIKTINNLLDNFKKRSAFYVISFTFLFLPSLVSAQTHITALISAARTWLGALVYIVIGIAIILFFWGIIKYVIAGANNEEGRQQGRNLIIYGIVGIFVMVSIWGLVYLVGAALGIGIGTNVVVSGLPTPTGGLGAGADSTLVALIKTMGGWIADIAILLIGLALVLFLWGMARYVASGADEEKRTEARRLIVYGVMGLFSMVAIWGLVYLVGATLGISIGADSTTPQIISIDIGKVGPNDTNVTITGTAMTDCVDWANTKSFKSFVCLILKILKPLPPILVALAVLYFFWGIAKYMNSGGDAEKLQNGRMTILYGILGMFVIVAVWGLVYLVQKELGLST